MTKNEIIKLCFCLFSLLIYSIGALINNNLLFVIGCILMFVSGTVTIWTQ